MSLVYIINWISIVIATKEAAMMLSMSTQWRLASLTGYGYWETSYFAICNTLHITIRQLDQTIDPSRFSFNPIDIGRKCKEGHLSTYTRQIKL